jgi:hypothetical protein
MKTIETLIPPGPETTADRALAILRAAGARFFDEALAANPDGPVEMVTDISRTEIAYEVVIGGVSIGDHGRARTIWTALVAFGASDAHCAGGAAFVSSARQQEAVAWAALELMEARRST